MLWRIKSHPGKYLSNPAYIKHILDSWHMPFSGMSIISNWATPLHTDKQGNQNWYDVLINMGHHPSVPFVIPGIRASFQYSPGTVISISGKLLGHQVPKTTGGDRVCFAFFMR